MEFEGCPAYLGLVTNQRSDSVGFPISEVMSLSWWM